MTFDRWYARYFPWWCILWILWSAFFTTSHAVAGRWAGVVFHLACIFIQGACLWMWAERMKSNRVRDFG